MATVIDTLVVELGIDPKKFVGGQKEVEAALKRLIENATKGGNEVENKTNQLISYFDRLKQGVLTTVGLFLGGRTAKDFMHFMSSADAATGRFAQTIDLNIQSLGAWENAIKSMGGSAESVRSTMGGLNADIKAFQAGTGGGQYAGIFAGLVSKSFPQGISPVGKNVDQILLDISKAVKERNPNSKSQQFFELMQIPGMNQEMANFLLLSEREQRGRLARGRASAPTDKDFERANEYQKATSEFNTAVERFGSAVGYLVGSPFAKALEGIVDLINAYRDKGLVAGAGVKANEQATGWARWLFPWVDKAVNWATGTGVAPGAAPASNPLQGRFTLGQIPRPVSTAQADYIRRTTAGLTAPDLKGGVPSVKDFDITFGKSSIVGASAGFPDAGTTVNKAGATSNTNINQVIVNTRATDADGIARDFSTAVKRNSVVAPVNFGQE